MTDVPGSCVSLLIEHLHKIQDHFGHLSSAHLAALAQEMRLAQTEVYEVATFYHHFDVVKEGQAAPAALTVRVCPADERADTEYPMVLITGRQLEHWHTGSMTRRATVLDALEPDPVALIHPLDLAALGAQPGDLVTIESRRGKVELYARAGVRSPRYRSSSTARSA